MFASNAFRPCPKLLLTSVSNQSLSPEPNLGSKRKGSVVSPTKIGEGSFLARHLCGCVSLATQPTVPEAWRESRHLRPRVWGNKPSDRLRFFFDAGRPEGGSFTLFHPFVMTAGKILSVAASRTGRRCRDSALDFRKGVRFTLG